MLRSSVAKRFAVERAPLHPDHAAADDRHGLGDLLQVQDLVGVDGEIAAADRKLARGRAGGDHDVPGPIGGVADGEASTLQEPGGSAKDGHPVGLHQSFDAAHQAVHDLDAALLGGCQVEAETVGDDTEAGPLPAQERIELGRLQQRLGRDAAADHAGPSQPIPLRDCDAGAELCRTDGRHVAPWAAS